MTTIKEEAFQPKILLCPWLHLQTSIT